MYAVKSLLALVYPALPPVAPEVVTPRLTLSGPMDEVSSVGGTVALVEVPSTVSKFPFVEIVGLVRIVTGKGTMNP